MNIILGLSLGGVIYYLTAIIGMSIFSFHPSNITVLWLPFAIGVVFTHYYGNKFLPFIFLGSFFANFSGMDNGNFPSTFLYTSIAAFADTLAPFLSATLLKRYVDDKFDSVKGFLPFSFYGIIIPTFFSSIIIALNLWMGSYISCNEVFSFILLLMFADGLGLYLLYPIYKNFSNLSFSANEIKYMIFFSLLIFTITYFSFTHHFLIFLLFPMILILALKIREDAVSIILFLTIIELIALSAKEQTIFHNTDNTESLLMLMSFISSLVFVVMGITQHQKDLLRHKLHSLTDALTQTKNRLSYKETIEDYIHEYTIKKNPFSMILFDIDDFKLINDNYSHRVGDIVLSDLSSLIQQNIRSSDSLFRVGGEEFVVLFPNTPLKTAVEIGEKLRKLVETGLNTISDKTITISLGVTEVQNNDTEDSLYRRVDKLLYISKHNGKNKLSYEITNVN